VATVAVLGTGIMGGPIARRLAEAGHDVRVWNRTRAKAEALSASGVEVASTPAEAAAGVQAIVTMLADGSAVEEVMTTGGAIEALPPGAVWIQMSTIGAAATDRLIAAAEEREVVFVDAPVLGSKPHAESGQLFVLASGPDDARTPCGPLFAPLARRVEWLGPAGHGSRLKLVFNNWILLSLEGIAETLALAEALDVEPGSFLAILEGEPFDMRYAHPKGALMLVLEEVEGHVELPLVAAALAQFDRAVELGHGDEDSAAVYLATGRD
jgi:3-hydroxyisobutyrate dehydrogenase